MHPTQKPITLYDFVFSEFAKPGDTILDTHMGSQSSRISAYKAGLDFTGCELDPEYFEQGNHRFNEFLKNFKEKNEQGWANIIDLSQEEQERKLLEKTPEQRKNEMVMLEEFRRRKNLERYYKEMKE
jgi:hypothetical protein